MRKLARAIGPLILLAWVTNGAASAQPASIRYQSGDTPMVGYLARPLGQTGRAPGILVVHDWMGLGPYARRRADELAGLGYVALAVDMYGGGKQANDNTEAAQLAGDLKKGDRAELLRRATAALETLAGLPQVDTNRLAAIGYCFGGTVVLELARSGAPLRASSSTTVPPKQYPIAASRLVSTCGSPARVSSAAVARRSSSARSPFFKSPASWAASVLSLACLPPPYMSTAKATYPSPASSSARLRAYGPSPIQSCTTRIPGARPVWPSGRAR